MDDRVSAYVPAYNAERTLGECLRSMQAQSVPFDEVIVVDDGSKDRTAEIAEELGLKVLRNSHNMGVAFCRNYGVTHARNELVASVDSDCVLDQKWLEFIRRALNNEAVAEAGGALLERYAKSSSDLWRLRHLPQHWGPRGLMNPPFLFGSNTISRKKAILALGGYDQKLTTNGEDVDMSRRLMKNGWRLLYDPRAVAYHLQRDTPSSVLRRWWRWHHPARDVSHWTQVARNAPQYLFHGLRYASQDLTDAPRLLPIDLAFPVVQAYLDVRSWTEPRSRRLNGR